MVQYDIYDKKDLHTLLNLIHDRSVDLDEVEYFESDRILSVPISIIENEPVAVNRRFKIIDIGEFRVLAATLKFYGVDYWRATDPDNIRTCCINTIQTGKDHVLILGVSPSSIELFGTNITVKFKVSDEEIARKRRWV